MTTHLQAEAQRPPSFFPPRPAVFRTPSLQTSTPTLQRIKTERTANGNSEFEDAPPSKRRKVDSPVSLDEQEHAEKLNLLRQLQN